VQSIQLNNAQDGVVATIADATELTADTLLYALGREPNYLGLHLDKAGLEADDRGWVRINKHHQTEQAHIYIVGDLAGRPSLASTAMEQGRLAAQHARRARRRARAHPARLALSGCAAGRRLPARQAG